MKESYEVRPSQSPWPRVMRDAWCRATVIAKPTMLCTVPAEVQLGCVLNSTVTPETRAFFCGGRPCPVKGEATVMSNVNGKSDVTPTESRIICTVGNLSRGSQETQRYPFHPWKRIGRKRREAITPICTSLAELFWKRGRQSRNT